MKEKSINLNWAELMSISEMQFPGEKKYGVYLWGFTIDDEFVPYYIGITEDIFLRIIQHLSFIIGGKYAIYHCDSLKNFADFKNEKVNPYKTNGKMYSPNWPNEYKLFIEDRKDLQKHIDFMVDSFTFSYATVDQRIILNKELKEIEKICINQIGKKNLQNTRAGYSDQFIIAHSGEKRITDKMKPSI